MTRLETSTSRPAPDQRISLDGFRRVVVSLNVDESRTKNFLRELRRRGFEVLVFDQVGRGYVLSALLPFLRAVYRSDFVICGTRFPWQIPWMLAARLLGRPCFVDCAMDIAAWPFPETRRWRRIAKMGLRSASCMLTIKSRAYLAAKFGLNRRRVLFTESCPDPELIDKARSAAPHFQHPDHSLLLCWSGGHHHHELERFMPTFQKLAEIVPNARLLIIAHDEKQSVVESLAYAEKAGLRDRVHVLGIIKPVEAFFATLAQCDLWVSTLGDSTLQGRQELRMEFLEAGLLGKAVIASRTPALEQHGFADGQEILYIDPTDPAGAAHKIARLAADPSTRQRLS